MKFGEIKFFILNYRINRNNPCKITRVWPNGLSLSKNLWEVGIERGIEQVINIEDLLISSSHRLLSLAWQVKA